MSDKDRVADDGGGTGGADDEDGEGPTAVETEGKCRGCGRKCKKLPFFRLKKKSKKLGKQKGFFVNSKVWGRRTGGGGGGGCCCLCVRQPKTLDSSGESPTSDDPNSSGFNFDMLRALIEKNEFYSKECNPHLDGDDL